MVDAKPTNPSLRVAISKNIRLSGKLVERGALGHRLKLRRSGQPTVLAEDRFVVRGEM